ncbi:MAG: pilus assembly protein [Chloroflexota bacterium]|nr:pilus assembly protein [Chloroflexota bacterium]
MRAARGQRGQGLVEFAVIFPIFAFFLFAVIDGGLLMGRYNNINNAAAEGARLAAVDGSSNVVADVVARVKDQTHGLLGGAGTSTSCADWDSKPTVNVICVQWVSGPEGEAPGDVGSAVRVRLRYRDEVLTPVFTLFGNANPGWDITACATQRLEQSVRPVPQGHDLPGVTTCTG